MNILYKNFISTCACGVAYFLTGWAFSFGTSWKGLLGTSQFALGHAMGDDKAAAFTYANFNFQFSFAAASTTIMSGAMAERTNILAYVLLTLFNCMFTYPIVAHWVWHPEGWLNVLGARDFAGDGPVHILGGLMGLCGTMFLGPRLGRFGYKRDVVEELVMLEENHETARGSVAEQEALELRRAYREGDLTQEEKDTLVTRAIQDNPPISSPGYVVFGTIVLWVSWYAFNAGSSGGVYNGRYITAFRSAMNTTVAAGAGGMTGFALSLALDRTWLDIRRPVNGALAALVGITGGCAWVLPWHSVIIGIVATLVATLWEQGIARLKIDDPVSATAVHIGGGITGLLLGGLFDVEVGWIATGSARIMWVQLVAIVSIISFGFLCGFSFLNLTNLIIKIRVSLWAEMFGIDAVTHNIVSMEDIDPDVLLNGPTKTMVLDPAVRDKTLARIRHNIADKKGVVFLTNPLKSATYTGQSYSHTQNTRSRLSSRSQLSSARIHPMANNISALHNNEEDELL